MCLFCKELLFFLKITSVWRWGPDDWSQCNILKTVVVLQLPAPRQSPAAGMVARKGQAFAQPSPISAGSVCAGAAVLPGAAVCVWSRIFINASALWSSCLLQNADPQCSSRNGGVSIASLLSGMCCRLEPAAGRWRRGLAFHLCPCLGLMSFSWGFAVAGRYQATPLPAVTCHGLGERPGIEKRADTGAWCSRC